MLGSTKNTWRCGVFTTVVLCKRGKTTSKLPLSVHAARLPPPFRISLNRRISLRTRLRVSSRADMYGWIGRFRTSWLGRMRARFIGSKIDVFAVPMLGLRLPNAVIGSAIKLGRGTNGTFSQSASRLCKSGIEIIDFRSCFLSNSFSCYIYFLFLVAFSVFSLSKLLFLANTMREFVFFSSAVRGILCVGAKAALYVQAVFLRGQWICILLIAFINQLPLLKIRMT